MVGVLYDSASAGQTVVHHAMILRTIPSHRADARCGGAEGSGDEARECFDAMGVREEEGRRGMRWMPWRQVPKKDVGSCEKHRGAGTAH